MSREEILCWDWKQDRICEIVVSSRGAASPAPCGGCSRFLFFFSLFFEKSAQLETGSWCNLKYRWNVEPRVWQLKFEYI